MHRGQENLVNDSGLVTRCPECSTSFRVTEDQLAVANGAVRCGACLQVFSATDHLVEGVESLQSEASGEQVQSITPEVRGMTAEDWAEIEADDAWEEDTLDGESASESEDLDEQTQEEFPEVDVLYEAPDIPGEELETHEAGEAVREETLLETADEDESGNLDPVDWEINVSGEADAFEGEIRVSVDPAELVANVSPSKTRRMRTWSLLAVLALAALVMQFAWFEMESLSQRADLRSGFLKACNALGCEVPDYADRRVMRAGDLIVRSHPDVENALAIDATVANLGPFRQAFPNLVLRFDAMDGTPVAARIFSPADYLAGELSGLKYVPGNTEVHISLEIVDPGNEAVNYSLSIQ
jgi:predicted Zn finger-like uncharacterized protein